MFVPLIHCRGYWAALQVIQASADEWKPALSQIDERRGEIHFAVKPRLHGVLIGGGHICQVSCHERTHMTGRDFLRQALVWRRPV